MQSLNLNHNNQNNISLSFITREDAETIRLWRNQNNIRRWFLHKEIISPEQQQQWFKNYYAKNDDYMFIIKDDEINKKIGCIALYNINNKLKIAEFGRLIIGDVNTVGKGYAFTASKLLCQFAFCNMNINTIYLYVYEDNDKAIHLYDKLGFEMIESDNDRFLKMILTKDKFSNV